VPIEPVEPRITTSRWAGAVPITGDSTGPLSDTRRHGRAAALTSTSDGGAVR
jgi:hypothetical protein